MEKGQIVRSLLRTKWDPPYAYSVNNVSNSIYFQLKSSSKFDFMAVYKTNPCFVGSCHHGMARPRIGDGGDGLQILKVAVNILDKQPQQPIRGGPPAWGLGEGLTTPHRKKTFL